MEKYRVILHLNENHKARVDLILDNMVNLLAGLTPERVEIELVANAGGIAALLATGNHHTDQIQSLAAQGVRFCLCANSMQQHGLTRDAFLQEVEVVSSGVGELLKKQALGRVDIGL